MIKTVLVADDDDYMQFLNRNLLEEIDGVVVVVASSFAEAVQLSESLKADCLVTDNAMPAPCDGPKLINLLREQQPDLPAILASGNRLDLITQDCADIGIPLPDEMFFINKGASDYADQLKSAVRNMLGV